MTVDGAALLGEPGHVEDSAALLFQMRRHSKECADRDDAGAAYTGDEDTVRLVQTWMGRFRQRR